MTAISALPGTRLALQLAGLFQLPLTAAFQETASGTSRSSSISTERRGDFGRARGPRVRGATRDLGWPNTLRHRVKNMLSSFHEGERQGLPGYLGSDDGSGPTYRDSCTEASDEVRTLSAGGRQLFSRILTSLRGIARLLGSFRSRGAGISVISFW